MRTREKNRIFRRFMAGDSVDDIGMELYHLVPDVEQAIRECAAKRQEEEE